MPRKTAAKPSAWVWWAGRKQEVSGQDAGAVVLGLVGEDLAAPFSHALYLFRPDSQRSICIGKRNSKQLYSIHGGSPARPARRSFRPKPGAGVLLSCRGKEGQPSLGCVPQRLAEFTWIQVAGPLCLGGL